MEAGLPVVTVQRVKVLETPILSSHKLDQSLLASSLLSLSLSLRSPLPLPGVSNAYLQGMISMSGSLCACYPGVSLQSSVLPRGALFRDFLLEVVVLQVLLERCKPSAS